MNVKDMTKKCAAILTAFMLVSGLPVAVGSATAVKQTRFNPDTDKPPANETPKPGVAMKQTSVCAVSAVLPGSQFSTIPANEVFQVKELHKYATGKGQTIAVIDSGVAPNVRLPRLRGGGDYILGGDGLADCDHHGTLIAGIIAAGPAAGDAFEGVAPDATILSIRQTSARYAPDTRTGESTGPSSLSTLASAIVRAADSGATVINMSVTACVNATANVDLRELRGAMHYAAVTKDVVLVSSAGNADNDKCPANPGPDPGTPEDDRGWDRVQTISLPSFVDQFVLSVGGTTLTGDPYINTLPGPWVDVAAPAINIVSLDPTDGDRGGLINAERDAQGTKPLSGTSFGAAYVSGLAALIRQRYPDLTANQVRNRIVNSAHTPAQGMNNVVGEGLVDPMLALTGDVSDGEEMPPEIPSRQSNAQPTPPPAHDFSRSAFMVIGIGVIALIACAAVVNRLRSTSRRGR